MVDTHVLGGIIPYSPEMSAASCPTVRLHARKRAMKSLLAVFILGSTVAYSQTTSPCPNPEKLEQICASVVQMDPDNGEGGGKFKYFYQRQVFEASCVDPVNDSIEMRNRKIADMWARYENTEFICNGGSFDMINGSIIKYAVLIDFDVFIRDVIRWGVNLNKVDASDGRTVLDYIQHHIDRSPESATARSLRQYYEWLRKAGARHKSEL